VKLSATPIRRRGDEDAVEAARFHQPQAQAIGQRKDSATAYGRPGEHRHGEHAGPDDTPAKSRNANSPPIGAAPRPPARRSVCRDARARGGSRQWSA